MRRTIVLVTLAIAASCSVFAGSNQIGNASLNACADQSCSNDYWQYGPSGVVGDEMLAWDAPATGSVVEYYEIWVAGASSPCLTTPGSATSALIAGTSCIAPNDTVALESRACNHQNADGTGAVQCSAFSQPVSFLPFTCIEGGREVPCYAGAPCRLPGARGGCGA